MRARDGAAARCCHAFDMLLLLIRYVLSCQPLIMLRQRCRLLPYAALFFHLRLYTCVHAIYAAMPLPRASPCRQRHFAMRRR